MTEDRIRHTPHVFMPSFAPHICSVCEHDQAYSLHDLDTINEHLRGLVTQSAVGDSDDLRYREYVQHVAAADVRRVLEKDRAYGASWKKRGGVGAYFAFVRKLDRLNNQIPGASGDWDVFRHLMDAERRDKHPGDESLLDTIRDIRGYLLLFEAEHTVRVRAITGTQNPHPGEVYPLKTTDDVRTAIRDGHVHVERVHVSHCESQLEVKTHAEAAKKIEQPPDLVCPACGAQFFDMPRHEGNLIATKYPLHVLGEVSGGMKFHASPGAKLCPMSNTVISDDVDADL